MTMDCFRSCSGGRSRAVDVKLLRLVTRVREVTATCRINDVEGISKTEYRQRKAWMIRALVDRIANLMELWFSI